MDRHVFLPNLILLILLLFYGSARFIRFPMQVGLQQSLSSHQLLSFLETLKSNPDEAKHKDNDGFLPLHVACHSKAEFEVIETLVESYPEALVTRDDKNHQLPIHHYLRGNVDVNLTSLSLLLTEYPHSVNVADKFGRLPIHLAAWSPAHPQVIKMLLDYNIATAGLWDADGKLPIHYAIEAGASKEVIGQLLDAHPKGAHDILVRAIENCDWPLVEELVTRYPAAAKTRGRAGKLLPLGVAVGMKAPLTTLIKLLEAAPAGAAYRDSNGEFDFTSTFRAACNSSKSDAISTLLVVLPINKTTGEEFHHHSGYWWTYILSQTEDKYSDIVDEVLVRCAPFIQALANTHDEQGRRAVDIATPKCRQLILSRLNFYGRYELRPGRPAHMSSTCIVRLALDHVENRDVALKFMKYRDHFERELSSRRVLAIEDWLESDIDSLDSSFEEKEGGRNLNSQYALAAIRTHDGDADESFMYEARIKGLGEYPYCVVMSAADRTLGDIMTHENIAGKDWKQIRLIMEQMAECVHQMHSRGFIHGDLKPLNVVRDGARMKLIDLDASVSFFENSYAGVKCSSAYAPPEMVYVVDHHITSHPSRIAASGDDTANLAMTTAPTRTQKQTYVRVICRPEEKQRQGRCSVDAADIEEMKRNLPYPLLPADPSYDIWSLGVIFYQLCTGQPLFLADEEDNVDQENLLVLADWDSETKKKRLAKVADPYARHLLSQLLNKDPAKRPLTSRLLAHPFLTGKKPKRMAGEKAEYDAFISYRVASDSDHAEALYRLLTAKGLKVWWDRVCLEPGVPWDEGFCEGLIKSRSFIPILSRAGMKKMEELKEDSPCDNMLLEYRMAQELRVNGLLEKIFPVMVGDRETVVVDCSAIPGEEEYEYEDVDRMRDPVLAYEYNDYIHSGCHPTNLPNYPLKTIESKLKQNFEKTSLGTPLLQECSIASLVDDMMLNHGGFVKGRLSVALLTTRLAPDTSKTGGDPDPASALTSAPPLVRVLEREFGKDAFTNVLEGITRMLKPKTDKKSTASSGATSAAAAGARGELSLLRGSILEGEEEEEEGSGEISLSPVAAIDIVERQLSQCTDVDQRIQLVEDHLKALSTILQGLKQERRRSSSSSSSFSSSSPSSSSTKATATGTNAATVSASLSTGGYSTDTASAQQSNPFAPSSSSGLTSSPGVNMIGNDNYSLQ